MRVHNTNQMNLNLTKLNLSKNTTSHKLKPEFINNNSNKYLTKLSSPSKYSDINLFKNKINFSKKNSGNNKDIKINNKTSLSKISKPSFKYSNYIDSSYYAFQKQKNPNYTSYVNTLTEKIKNNVPSCSAENSSDYHKNQNQIFPYSKSVSSSRYSEVTYSNQNKKNLYKKAKTIKVGKKILNENNSNNNNHILINNGSTNKIICNRKYPLTSVNSRTNSIDKKGKLKRKMDELVNQRNNSKRLIVQSNHNTNNEKQNYVKRSKKDLNVFLHDFLLFRQNSKNININFTANNYKYNSSLLRTYIKSSQANPNKNNKSETENTIMNNNICKTNPNVNNNSNMFHNNLYKKKTSPPNYSLIYANYQNNNSNNSNINNNKNNNTKYYQTAKVSPRNMNNSNSNNNSNNNIKKAKNNLKQKFTERKSSTKTKDNNKNNNKLLNILEQGENSKYNINNNNNNISQLNEQSLTKKILNNNINNNNNHLIEMNLENLLYTNPKMTQKNSSNSTIPLCTSSVKIKNIKKSITSNNNINKNKSQKYLNNSGCQININNFNYYNFNTSSNPVNINSEKNSSTNKNNDKSITVNVNSKNKSKKKSSNGKNMTVTNSPSRILKQTSISKYAKDMSFNYKKNCTIKNSKNKSSNNTLLNMHISNTNFNKENEKLKRFINKSIKLKTKQNIQNKINIIINKNEINNNNNLYEKNNNYNTKSSKDTHDANYFMNQSKKITKYITEYYTKNKNYPETNLNFYLYGRLIGQGAFGKVNLGLNVLTGRVVAIKSFNKKNLGKNGENMRKILYETSLMKKLNHPNITKILEVFEDQEYILISMEYINGGNLFSFVKKRRKLSEKIAKFLFKQIILGIKHIHSHNIVHRDIKLENILIDFNNNIKICDFGIGRILNSNKQLLHDKCGTPMYMAPEILISNKNIGYEGFPVDIWSSGIALYIMLSGSLPFNFKGENNSSINDKNYNNAELQNNIINNEPKYIEKISDEARDLLKKILNKNPNERLNCDQILNHPWLTGNKNANKKYNLFTRIETMMMSKTYIDYRKGNIDDLKENFSISNLINDYDINNNDKQILKNDTSKSSLLAPYNTLLSENSENLNDNSVEMGNNKKFQDFFEDINNENIKLEDNIIIYNNKVKEINLNYELNNNIEVDNGMIINSRTSSISEYSNNSISVRNEGEIDYEENYIEEEKQIKEKESKITKIFEEIEGMGYKKDYVYKCVKNNVLCHASAVFYLMMNYENI